MKTQPILVVSAILLIGSGLPLLFAPQELCQLLGILGTPPTVVMAQLLGSGLLGLGFLDWLNRFAVLGGIYGRPILLANFMFFLSAASTVTRYSLRATTPPNAVLAAVLALLAAGYVRLLFFPSVPARDAAPGA